LSLFDRLDFIHLPSHDVADNVRQQRRATSVWIQ